MRVVLTGLMSAVLAALGAALFFHLFETDLLAFPWGLLKLPLDYLPIGAFLFGCLAAGGLSAASILLNVRQNRLHQGFAPVVAVLAFVLNYVFQFWLVGNQPTPELTLVEFVASVVTGDELSIGVFRWNVGFGRVEEFGYVIAGFRLLAVSAGGWLGYRSLSDRPWCDGCNRYFRTVGEPKEFYFPNAEQFQCHRQSVADRSASLGNLAAHLAAPSWPRMDEEGAHYVATTLFTCRECRKQVLREEIQVHRDGSWTRLPDEDRKTELPAGSDFSPLFSSPQAT